MKKVAILGEEHTSTHLVIIAQNVLTVGGWLPVYVELLRTNDSEFKENIKDVLEECDAVIIDDTSGRIAISQKSIINYLSKCQKPSVKIVRNDLEQGSISIFKTISDFLTRLE